MSSKRKRRKSQALDQTEYFIPGFNDNVQSDKTWEEMLYYWEDSAQDENGGKRSKKKLKKENRGTRRNSIVKKEANSGKESKNSGQGEKVNITHIVERIARQKSTFFLHLEFAFYLVGICYAFASICICFAFALHGLHNMSSISHH